VSPGEDSPGNWGRWGTDDERGAANLVDSDKVRTAAGTVRTGKVYPLGFEISARRSLAHPARPRPAHFMTLDGGDFAAGLQAPDGAQWAEDSVFLPVHGTTHVDALSHFWAGDLLYNGHPATSVRSSGARRCGVEKIGALATRGVLLDLAAAAGLDHLPGGHVITAGELQACADRQGVALAPGDAVLIRTGWPRVYEDDPQRYGLSSPGIGIEAAELLADADVTLVGSDNFAVEAMLEGGRYDGGGRAPVVHRLLLRDRGIYMLEVLALDELAADAVWEFLFVLAPLRIVGGTGSPVNPVAIA